MTDADTRRVPPCNEDAEKAVLGALLYDNGAAPEAAEILRPDGADFYRRAHQVIFKTIMEMVDRGGVADLVTTVEAIRAGGNLEKVGGPAYIAGLADVAATSANIRHYAEIVKSKSNERQIIDTAQRMIESVYAGQADEAIATAQNLSIERGKNPTRTGRDVAKATLAQVEELYNRGGAIITGKSTGLKDLDQMTGGLPDGGLIIIAGRPGTGKSALSGHIAKYAALSDIPTAIFSLEMPAEMIMQRFFADMAAINSRQLRRGFVRDSEWPAVTAAASRIGSAPLFFDDRVSVTPQEIRAKAIRLKAEHDLGLLVVDYIQLVRVPGKHDTREQAVAEISRTLKAIARELNIPVIGLSQLNRQVDSRTEKRPMLSDLRESGAIEQDADIIAFIYRDELYNKRSDNPNRGIVELEVAKQRNGPTGTIKLRFNPATQTFSDMNTASRA